VKFIELFAGQGLLSRAVSRVGIDVAPPEDAASGGADFEDPAQINKLKELWRQWFNDGWALVFHAAPPCSSFSRARDRSKKTRLRSKDAPEGLYPDNEKTVTGNTVAIACTDAVKSLVAELDATGTWEQPLNGYMFRCLDKMGHLAELPRTELILHQCMFGTPYRKPTV